MGARMWHADGQSTGTSMLYLDFSFLTNGTANPTTVYATDGSTIRGEGVATVVRAAAGRYTVTLADGYRYISAKGVDLEDYASGSDDGAYASLGPVTGEGGGNHAPISFDVFTRTAGGVKTDYGAGGTGTPRRVSFSLAIKQSGSGK